MGRTSKDLAPGTVARTVKVVIHLSTESSCSVGIITSEWQGPTRVDRRLARVWKTVPMGPPPPGVDAMLWRAHGALLDLVDQQRTD